MHLIHLKLVNIASYGNIDNELDFSSLKYPLLVIGPNASGKTTFFVDGITFALFKSAYGRGPTGTGSATRLILPAGKKVSGYLELTFEVGGEVYRIRRRGSWSRDSVRWESSLYKLIGDKGRERIAIQDEVDKKIRKLMGFDYKTFLNSVVVRQGDVFSFIDKGDSERRDLLLRLINLELDKYRELIKEKLEILNNKISELNGALETDKKLLRYSSMHEIDMDEKRFLNEKKYLENELSKLDDRMSKLQEEKQNLDRELGGFINANSRIQKIKGEIMALKNRVVRKGLKIDIEEVSEIERSYNNIKMSVESLSKIEETLKRYMDILEKFRELDKLIRFTEELEEKKGKLVEEATLKNIELSEEYIASLKANIKVLRKKLPEINESIELLRSSKEPNCPLCGSPLDEAHRSKVLSKLSIEYADVEKRLGESERLLNYSSKIYEEYTKIKRDIDEYMIKVDFYRKELEDVDRSTVENIVEKLDAEKRSLMNNINKELKDFCKLFAIPCDINSYHKLYELYLSEKQVLDKIRSLTEELEGFLISFDKERYAQLTRKADELSKSIKDVLISKEKLYENLNTVKNNLAEIERQRSLMNDKNKLEKQLNELNEKRRLWNDLLHYVFADSRFPRSLLKDLVEDFLTPEANRYLSIILPSASVRLSISEEGRGISLDVYIDDVKREKPTLSGGEKTLIGFSIRLAISSLATTLAGGIKPDFIIVDEGFGPLDEDNSDLIAETLGKLVKNELIKQVIIITHEAVLKNHPVFREVINIAKIRGISHIKY